MRPSMAVVAGLHGKEIPDSRGKPTVEVELTIGSTQVMASISSGASIGVHEARTITAKDAVAAINGEIVTAIVGKEFNQESLDKTLCTLDGTPKKSRLGANAILGVSIAFARAQAKVSAVPLYKYLGSLAGSRPAFPCSAFNVINGGKHADDGLTVQEFMLVPVGIKDVDEQVKAATACMDALKKHLLKNGFSTDFGDEGGFAPRLKNSEEALAYLAQTVSDADFDADKIRLSVDVAASGLLQQDGYHVDGNILSSTELLEWYKKIAQQYNLLSIEDPFGEDDWSDFSAARAQLPSLIVCDDLTVTSTDRIARAAQEAAINAVVIKPNQAGTVTEAIAATKAAQQLGWKIFASHRSGETADSFIADFAVGLACDFIKAGAPTRPERMAKYNRLIEIEKEL